MVTFSRHSRLLRSLDRGDCFLFRIVNIKRWPQPKVVISKHHLSVERKLKSWENILAISNWTTSSNIVISTMNHPFYLKDRKEVINKCKGTRKIYIVSSMIIVMFLITTHSQKKSIIIQIKTLRMMNFAKIKRE